MTYAEAKARNSRRRQELFYAYRDTYVSACKELKIAILGYLDFCHALLSDEEGKSLSFKPSAWRRAY
jgi:hypothetical protein